MSIIASIGGRKRCAAVALTYVILGVSLPPLARADQSIGIREEVIQRDRLRCGVSANPVARMEELYCRAVALAVLGDATKVEVIVHNNANKYAAARHDPAVNPNLWVDVSFVTSGTTVGKDGDREGLTFTSPIRMDRFVPMGRISSASGQSVLSSPSDFMAIRTPAGLGAYFLANPSDRICTTTGGPSSSAAAAGVPPANIYVSTNGPGNYAADNGGVNGVPCHAVVSTNLTLMASTAIPDNGLPNVTLEHTTFAGFTRDVNQLIVDGISRQADNGDQRWDTLVNAIVNGVQTAALYGVDNSNVTAMCNSWIPVPHDQIAQLLGITTTLAPPQAGDVLGLRNDWACDVIAQLGNYDQFWGAVSEEIYVTTGVIVDQATFYNGFNRLFLDPSGLPTGGLIVPIAPSGF